MALMRFGTARVIEIPLTADRDTQIGWTLSGHRAERPGAKCWRPIHWTGFSPRVVTTKSPIDKLSMGFGTAISEDTSTPQHATRHDTFVASILLEPHNRPDFRSRPTRAITTAGTPA